MNWTNISLAAIFASLSLLAPLEITSRAIAQEIDENVTLEKLNDNPEKFLGQIVSVRGETEEVESGSIFILSSEEGVKGIFGEDEVLVINTNNEPSLLPKEDADVQVTGEVAEFILEDVNREYGLNLDPEEYAEYEFKPVILARSIALAPEPGEVTKNPRAYYDKQVAVEGEVKDILSSNFFTLDEDQLFGGSDLVVINLTGEPLPTKEEQVVITGVIRPLVKEDLERYYSLRWDVAAQETVKTESSRIPVLIADGIFRVGQ